MNTSQKLSAGQKGSPRSRLDSAKRVAVEAGFAPILIVILIALAVGGYLIYQKQTKPVFQSSPSPVATPVASSSAETINPDSIGANWKTYKNSQSKYTLKYPSEWGFRDVDIKLLPEEDRKVFISHTSFSKVYPDNPNWRKDIGETPSGDPLLSVKKTEGKTLQQITEDFKKYVTEGHGKVKKSETRMIDNTEAVLIVINTEFADPKPSYFDYYFVKNQRVYKYSYRSLDESPALIPETILSTFKFTQ